MDLEIIESRAEEVKKLSKELWSDYYYNLKINTIRENKYYKIELDGKEIGIIILKLRSGVLYIKDIILKNESRGNKIGHKTMEFCLDLAQKENCHKMRVKTCPEIMPTAYYLYKKHGFTEETILKNDYFNKDWVILSKYL